MFGLKKSKRKFDPKCYKSVSYNPIRNLLTHYTYEVEKLGLFPFYSKDILSSSSLNLSKSCGFAIKVVISGLSLATSLLKKCFPLEKTIRTLKTLFEMADINFSKFYRKKLNIYD